MADSQATSLHFDLLGEPRWRTLAASGRLDRKFAPLVGYLAQAGRQPRDTLAQLLWPGDPVRANDNLRQHERRLRRLTNHPVFAHGEAVQLLEGIDCDTRQAPSEWPTTRLMAAEEFLAGVDLPDLQRFMTWLAAQRKHWHHAIADALCERALGLQREGRLGAALPLAERATVLAPRLETAWRLCMAMRLARGDHAAGLEAFAGLEAQLRHQPGLHPGRDTLTVRDALRAAAEQPPPPGLQRLPAALLHPPRLIGRQAAWQAMASAWQAGRPFLLRGEAGFGKSRLLGDFLRGQPGVVFTEARPGDEHSPYAVMADIVRIVMASHAPRPGSELRSQLGAVVPELVGAAGPTSIEPAVLRRAVESFLVQAADAGLRTLAVDDLQFADRSTLDMLRWLTAGSLRKCLGFAFASRPTSGGLNADLVDEWLTDSQRPEPVELSPWTVHDLAELLASLGIEMPVAATELLDHAGGQPFLTIETLKQIAQQPARASGLPRPATAAPLLESRIRSLPERTLPLLGLAAVFGADFRPARDVAVLGVDLAEASARLAELEAAGMMCGERFVHELMRQAVLARLPVGQRRRWHGEAASALAGVPGVPVARVAAHWQAAERWAEAGAAFLSAGRAAGDVGRLVEQEELLAEAGAAFARAGDAGGEFDALHAGIEGLMTRLGPNAVRDRLPQMEALANTPERVARVAIIHASVRVNHFQDPQALAASEAAVALAGTNSSLRAEALMIHGMALAQAKLFDAAISALQQARAACAREPGRMLQVQSAVSYVHYEAGRLGEAIAGAREVIGMAEAVGDRAVAGQMQGNLATLVMVSGDPASAVAPARAARERHREIGSAENSVLAGMTLVTLGSALLFGGIFAEAIEVLDEALQLLSIDSPAAARAKAQLALAHAWLLLGAGAKALAVLPDHADHWPPPLRLQWHWAQARAAVLRRAETESIDHLRCMGAIQADHWDAPLSQSSWLEWSRQGPAAAVATQMARVSQQYDLAGMPGTARSARLRQIDRLGEVAGAEAEAARLARAMRPQLADGLHPSTYLPEAWEILARSFARGGDAAAADECLASARGWIDDVALAQVPPPWRSSFLGRNPVNAWLLSVTAARSA